MLEIASNGLLRFLADYTLALSATHADVGSVVSTLEQGVTNPVRVTGEGAALILDPGDGLMDLLTGFGAAHTPPSKPVVRQVYKSPSLKCNTDAPPSGGLA